MAGTNKLKPRKWARSRKARGYWPAQAARTAANKLSRMRRQCRRFNDCSALQKHGHHKADVGR